MNKTHRLHIRCTPDFQETMKRCSKEVEMTQANFIRESVYHYIGFLEKQGLIKKAKN